ncbi:hypothetical protein QQX13_01390 [Demequina sp. SYSU T00068]|uniref:hypothetical protein n=1 Tax=Demequina lignilytica TaxID=3051663 RepID=UPI002622C133|nr:hypothetical protein [Demequina sp. SYSU T00068]MDN4489475.1 hypothetical protein [Demequina sp. SYSU T00068]
MSGGVWPEGTHESRTCSVHPFGYHRSKRVNDAPSRTVFRDVRWGGLPRRCEWLEHELDVSGREPDFIDELWIRERSGRGHGLAVIGVTLTAAVLVSLILAGTTTVAAVITVVIGGALVLGLDRGDAALHHERLRRIRDWHKRVGSPR